eukprot:2717378-Alexandrium_andersonii.AAC.1
MMAPAKAAPPSSVAPTEPSSSASASSGPPAQTLVEKALASEGSSKRRRTLSKRDTDEQVSKAIADNFKQFTSQETDGLIHEGKTLRQRLQEDKRSHKANPKMFPMGQRYYQTLREEYSSKLSLIHI